LARQRGVRIVAAPAGDPARNQEWLSSNGVMADAVISTDTLASSIQATPTLIVAESNGVDRTDLTGLYDFILYWTPEKLGATSNADSDLGISIFTAIEQQLGLTLVPTKGQVPLLVIDSAEKVPIEN
jgi:uncharacterized protein (TIGR03435 family)